MSDYEYLDDDVWNEDDTQTPGTSRKAGKTVKKRQVKPKVTAEWSDNDIFKLISCVEVLPMLWNASNEKYRNKIERQSAWKNMSELDFESRFTGEELLAKWNNIRIQYRSYLSKKTKSGQAAQDHIKWKFYPVMEFVGRAEEDQRESTISSLVCEMCFEIFFISIMEFCICFHFSRLKKAAMLKKTHTIAPSNHLL